MPRWKYAAGGLSFDYPGFVHTVLVDMRARLAASDRPNRIFEVTLAAARKAGLVGRRRVLDSTPLYDAVATMDTVTLIRSAIRGVLKAAEVELEAELRTVLARDDDYANAGKPVCDYDDVVARTMLVDALAKDAKAVLGLLDGRQLEAVLAQAAALLATVVGQDLDEDTDGVFRIARRVAKDRVISTVDPETRHGHKTAARGFDGYKGHIGIDPESEIITATTVTAGNAGDASVAEDLIADLLEEHTEDSSTETGEDTATVYGDNAYGTGSFHDRLEQDGIESKCKSQQPVNSGGRFNKNEFGIDLEQHSVTCPAGNTAPIRYASNGAGTADFGQACAGCPLREQCTTSGSGRTIMIGLYERQLAAARDRQRDPDWIADYRATRPKVERKIGHLMRRRHGGRARVRGQTKVTADFSLLAAAVNVARLGVLGLTSTGPGSWAAATS